MPVSLALDAALALGRNPVLAPVMRAQPVPSGMETVLRIVSGDDGVLKDMAERNHVEASFLLTAAEAYVQQVLIYPGAPASRVLGVQSGAAREEMRAHMRLLLLWLHPDRGQTAWRTGFAARVIEAWREGATQGQAGGVAGGASSTIKRRHTRPARWLAPPLPLRSRASRRARRARRKRIAAIFILAALSSGGLAWLARDNPGAVAAFGRIAAILREAVE